MKHYLLSRSKYLNRGSFNLPFLNSKVIGILPIIYLFVFGANTFGQTFNQASKIIHSDREMNDRFGEEVAIDGDYAVVGASAKNSFAGAAYVYQRNANGTWTETQILTASDPAGNDTFGFSVGISGDYIIVGAPNEDEDENGNNTLNVSGSAYIFKRNASNVWLQHQKIKAITPQAGALFGTGVAIDGNFAIVGAPRDVSDGNNSNGLTSAGAVFLYEKNVSDVWIGAQKLAALDRAIGDQFGHNVSINGVYAIVGVPNESEDVSGNNTLDNAGSAYLIERSVMGNWSVVQKVTASDRGFEDEFGSSVAINGNYAIVGSPEEDEDASGNNTLTRAGSAYIFFRSSGVWSQQQKIVSNDREANDFFGNAVSIQGNRALVGARLEDQDEMGNNILSAAGSAYLFERNTTVWGQSQKLLAADRGVGDVFGWAVAISSDHAIIGAIQDDTDENDANPLDNAGSAYLFALNLAPTDIQISSNSVFENSSTGTAVGTFTTTDPNGSLDTHSYSLIAGTGGADNGRFRMNGDVLETNETFDFETQGPFSILVQTDDNKGGTFSEAFTINLQDANDVPTDIMIDSDNIDENSGEAVVGNFSTTDQDDRDSHTYDLVRGDGDDHNNLFGISGNRLVARNSFNFEDGDRYSIRVETEDESGKTYDEAFTIRINDVQEDPTGVSLSPASVDENEPSGTIVGILRAIDDDTRDIYTYRFATGMGDTDNALFDISDDELSTLAAFDHETEGPFSIRVLAEDAINRNSVEEILTISVNDVSEPSTGVTLDNMIIAENSPAGTLIGNLGAIDEDDNETYTFDVVSGAGDDSGFFRVAGDQLQNDAVLDFDNPSDGDTDNLYEVTISVNDGTNTTNHSVEVLVTPEVEDFLGTFTQLGQDIDGEAGADFFGSSVSLSDDGRIVAIGGRENNGNGLDSGHIRVYSFNESTGLWEQLGTDIDGEAAFDEFGISVSLSGDGTTFAAGASLNDGTADRSGHVRVFNFNGTDWVQLGTDIDGEAESDRSGNSVSLSNDGSIVAVGADFNDGNGSTSGHVRVFEFNGSDWVQLGSDIDGEAPGDLFGRSVDLNVTGSTVAIGARDNNGTNGADAGHVRVFDYNGTDWVQKGNDIDGEMAFDRSGASVGLSADGDIVAIGAWGNDAAGTDAGHVRVFGFDGTDWVQRGGDIDGEQAEDRSGLSLSLSADGSTVAIGANQNDGSGSNAGHVRIYQFDGANWVQRDIDIDGERGSDQSGGSVSISADGTTVAIGAEGNTGTSSRSGHVRVYDLVENVPEFTTSDMVDFVENGTGTVLDVNANNGDGGAVDEGISYSLSGADNALFSIDTDGLLTFDTPPDFEAPQDNGMDNTYNITVTADDGFATLDQAITINVTDVDDTPPVLVSRSPEDVAGPVNAPVDTDLTITFDENIVSNLNTSNEIRLFRTPSTLVESFDDNSRISIVDETITIDPTTDLMPGTEYQVVVLSGALEDALGNGIAPFSWTFTTTKLDQTIVFNAFGSATFGDANITLPELTDAGLTITYVSDDLGVASVTNNILTIQGAGTTDITASQSGNSQYNPAMSVVREITVDPANVDITLAANTTVTYNGAPRAVSASALDLNSNPLALVVEYSVQGEGNFSQTAPTDAGTYDVRASLDPGIVNYTASLATGLLTIDPRGVTVTVNAGQTKVYGQSDPALFAFTAAPALESGDNFSGSLSRAGGENVGTYTITQGSFTAGGNYTITFNSADFAITRRGVTVNVNAGQTKVYGQADPDFTFTAVPALESGDDFSGDLGRATGDNVGTYAINQGTLTAGGNYTITFNSADFAITPRGVTVNVNAGQTKVYRQMDPVNFTFMATPALETGDNFSGNLERAAGENAGSYAINQGSLTAGSNYTITFNSEDFTITPRGVSVDATVGLTKVYGANDPALTFSASPALESGDNFSGSLEREMGENVGTYNINQGTLSAGPNYTIAYDGSEFTITRRGVTVTVDAGQTKVYGQSDPAFAFAATPALESGDNFSGSLSRTGGENVGTYAITQGSLTAGGNYTITFNSADFDITRRGVTVNVNAGQNKVYGQADPANFTFTPVPALESGDNFSGDLERATGDNVGTYNINQGTLSAGPNYTIAYDGSEFTITPRGVTVNVNAGQTKVYRQMDPANFTFMATPALETGDNFSGSLERAAGENAGNYAINQGSLTAGSNYTITFNSEDFAITPRGVSVDATVGLTKVFGESDPEFTFSASPGLESGDSFSGQLERESGNDVGTYNINQGTLTAGPNYTIAYDGSEFTITPRSVTINLDANTMVTFDGDPQVVTPTALDLDSNPLGLLIEYSPQGDNNFSSTAPVNAGTYDVRVQLDGSNNNYQAVNATGLLTIDKATATITLGSLEQVFDGTPRAVTAETNPTGLTVNITYDGSGTVPANADTYTIVATIDDANYVGTANGTLTISRADQVITFNPTMIEDKLISDTDPISIDATANSGLTVMLDIEGPASLSMGMITLNGTQGTVTVTASQGGNENYNEASATLSFLVIAPNVAPTDIALGNSTLTENSATKTVVGIFTTTDGNITDSHSYFLVTGEGDTNNASFSINGDQLLAEAVFDFEAQSTYSVRIQTDDGRGETFEKAFTITIVDGNDAPTIATALGNETRNEGFNSFSVSLSGIFTDQDGDNLQLSAGSSDEAVVTVSVTGTDLTVTEVAAGTATITVTASDGNGGMVAEEFTVTVNASVNNAPTVANALEDQAADAGFGSLTLDLSATFADADGDNLTLTASSSDANIATVAISGTILTITEVGTGTVTIIITADDGNGGSVSEQIEVTINVVTGIEEEILAQVQVYPNPSTDYFQVDLPMGEWSAQVISPTGQVRLTVDRLQSTQRVEVAGWTPGIYFLRLFDENNSTTTIKLSIR